MIFNELKATEENYHKALTTTVKIFLNPLRDALGTENEGTPMCGCQCHCIALTEWAVLNDEELEDVFGNISEVLASSAAFVALLQGESARFSEETAAAVVAGVFRVALAKVLTRTVLALRSLTLLCSGCFPKSIADTSTTTPNQPPLCLLLLQGTNASKHS